MKKFASLLTILLVLSDNIYGQEMKRYETKAIHSSIIIDANIDEAAWEHVDWAGDFVQTEPANGTKPTFDTQFKILYDQNNLYVAIRAYDKHPDSIVVEHKPRDFFAGDYVEINIDSDFEMKDAFSFTVTAAGVRGDEHILNANNWQNDWNPQWTAKTRIDTLGWVAEFKIPLRELEVYAKKEQWGIQINRSIERLDEGASWSSIPDEDKWVESFGLLSGIENMVISNPIGAYDTMSTTAMIQDFSLLYEALKAAYPSLYRYHTPDFVDQIYTKKLKEISLEMTLTQYYGTVTSFLALLGDGHMKVELPDYAMQAIYNEGKHLPFLVKVNANGLTIRQNFVENEKLNGAIIVSMEGIPTAEIVRQLSEIIPSDGYNLTGKYYKLSQSFGFYYALIFGAKDKISLEYLSSQQQEVRTLSVNTISKSAVEEWSKMDASSRQDVSFTYQTLANTGVIGISTFNDAEGFKGFVDQSFQKLATSKIDRLIIDLRGNGGGEETNAIYLYSYIANNHFKFYDRYEVGVEPQNEINQESTIVSYETLNFLALAAAKDKKGRNILTDLEVFGDRFIDPNQLHPPNPKNHFSGKVAILIDGGSFSATSEFCAIAARDDRAMFFGNETGGGFDGNTSGIYDQITLPNSRLKIRVPLIKYVSDVENASFVFGRGIIPHYQIPALGHIEKTGEDKLLDFAIKYLNMDK